MNINELITFKRAAELLNFSKTAKDLNYSQSAVTVQIKNLEEEFGIQLFDRIGKNVRLTPDGENLLHYANKIINAVENAKDNVGQLSDKKHLLRVGCIDSICSCQIPEIIKILDKKGCSFPIKITTSSPSKLLDMMEKNEIDLVYILDKPIHNNNWIKAYNEPEDLIFITSMESNLLKNKSVKIEDIVNEDFYLTETNDNYRYALDQRLAELNLEVHPILEVSNTDVIISTICSSHGIGFLPSFAVSSKPGSCSVSILDVENVKLNMFKQVFYHKDKFLTEEMKYFIEAIKETGI